MGKWEADRALCVVANITENLCGRRLPSPFSSVEVDRVKPGVPFRPGPAHGGSARATTSRAHAACARRVPSRLPPVGSASWRLPDVRQ